MAHLFTYCATGNLLVVEHLFLVRHDYYGVPLIVILWLSFFLVVDYGNFSDSGDTPLPGRVLHPGLHPTRPHRLRFLWSMQPLHIL
jgi:hypothetical protein